MKNLFTQFAFSKSFFRTICLITIFMFASGNAESNWLKPEVQSSVVTEWSASQRSEKTDSLPEGVTSDWLNNLRDENGNNILPEEPGTDAVQRKSFNGLNANEHLGYSVRSAGDVNGDGYDDIIVGAEGYSANTGRAYIFFGGIIMNSVADLIMTGEATGNFFGISVSSAGDVNGDGYSDVIVGAIGYTTATGRAYIYFGGAAMNNTADIVMTGETTNNNFGISVSSAGDVNGDGYSDVIVGAERYTSFTGRAYIYLGGAAMNNVADVTMTGEATSNNFGASVSSAGDVNADGYSDVIVGAYGYSSFTGRAYVYFGGASMNNTADVTMTGETTSNNFGASVSSAGDANGDGYSDVIAGAYTYTSSTGRAYIYFGGASMNNVADVTLTGETTNIFFGYSVSLAGDLNGDGYSDVIAGAYGFSLSTGRAYVFFGGASMNNVADITMTGEAISNNFGYAVSSAGDVNGDGYSDLLVGAYGNSSNFGRAYVFDYYMKNEITQDLTMTGEGASNSFGRKVSSAGDVNGDGFADVIVGAYSYSSFTGRAYIYFGGSSMNNVADVTMTGEASANGFGISVSTAGDVNGDGFSDVIVGADGYSTNTGRAYVYFGGAAMNNIADVTMTGEAFDNNFGNSVSTAGDVNGDGYSDVIAGAPGNTSFTGRAYIFLGGASMNNVADVTMSGETFSNGFGLSVSSAGNVNGDGYSDVIVGASGYSSSTGRAYIFLGGAVMNNVADVTMTGEASSNFGQSVSSAGDVNGDGYSDVISGAFAYSSSTGRAYIYLGGAVMNNTADVTMTGENINNNFGVSVSSAGDLNGDGYSDVIIGATGLISNTGKAYIYFGAAAMNDIADVTMSGETTNNYFGTSVSTAGDVNGDGYSDVIVGADAYSTNTGRSYIYNGSAISAKPVLNYVKDVPNDQGGKVILKWARSSLDVIGDNTITDYVVYRSYPPSGGGFSWGQQSVISASKRSFYSYTDNTPSDSSSGGNGTMYYQIMARTTNSSVYWLSGILSGRSLDNIAPLMLSPFTAAPVSDDVRLTWNRSSAPDLLNYILYRNTSPTIDPNTEPVFATTTDTTYLDTSPLSGVYYYFIVAQDIHNNKSPVAFVQSPGITLNLTVFIEGFYNPGINTQVSDTVTVYLRNITSPFAVVDQAKAVVSNSGTTSLLFTTAPSGQYYIVVVHRNSIETWSKTGGENFTGSLNYDFSNSSSQAFGSNMKQVDAAPLRFAIYSGDANQDGFVNLNDIIFTTNNSSNFINGYVSSDLNGDNITNLNDILIAFNNSNLFVSKVTP